MKLMKKNPAVYLGIIITVLFLILGYVRIGFLDKLEYAVYDIMMGLRAVDATNEEIVIVDIDDGSIEKIGRWPWSRSIIADGIEKISRYNPKAIGLNIIYSEKDNSSKLLYRFEHLVGSAVEGLKNADRLMAQMEEIRYKLDDDRALADAIKASGKVVLPVFCRLSRVSSDDPVKDKALVEQIAIRSSDDPKWGRLPKAGQMQTPLPMFVEAARGTGHVNLDQDIDGKLRRQSLFLNYRSYIIPSFTFELASIYLNAPDGEVEIDPGNRVSLGAFDIPLSKEGELLISFKGPQGAFEKFSYFDVINEKIPPSLFEGRIVLISPSASGVMNPLNTAANSMCLGEYSANAIWSILHQSYIKVPDWGKYAALGIILLIGAVISFVMPKMKAATAGVAFLAMILLLCAVSVFMFISKGLWLKTTYPILQLIIGYISVVTLSYFATETRKEQVEGESADTNRMLGLSFQSQGMLDMAFDKFRKVPVNDEMKNILYNLALDYERKRQFNKAAAVYGYIEEYDSDYKDVSRKKERLTQASDSMVYGDGFLSGSGDNDPLLTIASGTRPTLGRYEVIKQLGKGAMGVVYLGQDPRINRTTAIKTFRFLNDFEPDEVEKLKIRFFREAESAGTLSHPNIVTIYDAGEEQDLAYIAMEYLEGDDLSKFVKKKTLMPMRKVIDYVADIADALGYAHDQGVVHRDIKPANIMVLKSGVVKVTDFGIARITATSQTQTGVVKGTPHYMSPEQISGEKVDGRSDIFSLGVMLFQMLTGSLPFKGDSPAALMHQIMNKPHPDPRKYNPKLPKPIVAIIDKAMEKDRSKRYQKANQMAAHLRTLGQKMDELKSKKKPAE